MDIDAAGGVATAGLIGGALERPTGHAGDAHGDCTDCGAPVDGNFCANCGQPTHVHRTLHLIEEVLHGVVHFDGRIWRTLPLLMFRPGRLTREWIEGRRTRYVSPLAIFLFTIFLMFFAFSFLGGSHGDAATPGTIDEQIAAVQTDLVEARAELTEARAGLNLPTGAEGKTYTDAGERAAVDGLERRLTQLQEAKAGGQTTAMAESGWAAELAESARNGTMKVNSGFKSLDKIIVKKAMNPELALYKVQQTAYKFSFLLVPFSIPFVALLFLWRRGTTWYDHGVFVLYSLTAMSILLTVSALMIPVWTPFAWLGGLAIAFGPPVHMFFQLKGTYRLSVFSALWRTMFLVIFSQIVVTLFLIAIIMLGLTS